MGPLALGHPHPGLEARKQGGPLDLGPALEPTAPFGRVCLWLGSRLGSLHPAETDEQVADCAEVAPKVSEQPRVEGGLSRLTIRWLSILAILGRLDILVSIGSCLSSGIKQIRFRGNQRHIFVQVCPGRFWCRCRRRCWSRVVCRA